MVRTASRWRPDRGALRFGLAAGAGVLAGAVTRWPVGALLAVGAGAMLPALASGRAVRQAAVARAEAIAAWAEMLRDTLAGAAGLEQAIIASAPVAPAPIRPQVLGLAARLDRHPLPAALEAFADDLADPTADLVVASLLLASRTQARRLGELLGTLARGARDDVTIDHDRQAMLPQRRGTAPTRRGREWPACGPACRHEPGWPGCPGSPGC